MARTELEVAEAALDAALGTYLRACGALGDDEMLTAWVLSFAGEIPSEPDAHRGGFANPRGQRYYVSHGLAAALMASFNAGYGSPHTDDGDENAGV